MRNTFINDYFGFTRQQRNGLWVLLVLSFLLLLVRLIYPHFIKPDPMVICNLPLIERRLDSAEAASERSYASRPHRAWPQQVLFAFDPNTVTQEQLLQLGFREKTAGTFLKFRQKGFVFKNKKDLQKVYGISDKFYAKLEPYIVIGPAKEMAPIATAAPAPVEPAKPAASKAGLHKIELNTADSAALVALNGIGPAYARRILKYRSILGGFVSTDQLMEVYGFSEELFNKIKASVEVNDAQIKKINLNTDDFKTVNRHPYLSYELTKAIFNQRRLGALTAASTREVLNDEALYTKLLPYLVF